MQSIDYYYVSTSTFVARNIGMFCIPQWNNWNVKTAGCEALNVIAQDTQYVPNMIEAGGIDAVTSALVSRKTAGDSNCPLQQLFDLLTHKVLFQNMWWLSMRVHVRIRFY